MPADPTRGLLDTNIMILRHSIESDELPDEMAISAVTLADTTNPTDFDGLDAIIRVVPVRRPPL